jgi:hypothetical protein
MVVRNGTVPGRLMTLRKLFVVCLILGYVRSALVNAAFVSVAKIQRNKRVGSTVLHNSWNQDEIDAILQKQTRIALMESLVIGSDDDVSSLIQVHLIGRADLPTAAPDNKNSNSSVPCLVLSPTAPTDTASSESCLMMPILDSNRLKLVQLAHQRRPLSKSVLLNLNSLLVNRDDALFDNLPWSTWTLDPQKRNYDAANNPILSRFHLGKRDAYYRMLGKDWKGMSASFNNLAMRLQVQLEREQQEDDSSSSSSSFADDESSQVLARRMLELEIRELQMELAELDSQLAIARTNQLEELNELEESRQECLGRLSDTKEELDKLNNPQQANSGAVQSLLERITDLSSRDEKGNAAPYRGATGYAPFTDSAEDIKTTDHPFTSPFDVLRSIIEEQLNADVIGAVLENTSLLDGTLTLGGAVILQGKAAKKTMALNGEELSIQDEDEDFGNQGVKGGECLLVECDGDEAVGMALACNATLSVESSGWERANLAAELIVDNQEASDSLLDALPLWSPLDKNLALLTEGQARNASAGSEPSPLRIPRTTASLYDALVQSSSSSSRSSKLFPDDNPIQSLDEYDALSNDDKARTLMSLSNFDGKLPRPRVLRRWDSSASTQNPLDKLLLPLIDESVRKQYLIRDAESRQDTLALEELQSTKSPRQVAKEKAKAAREVGQDAEAEAWEKEAELYANLRADVTQDEGAYSRFLDRDEWYEREQKALRERNKKFKFGTLLDGID